MQIQAPVIQLGQIASAAPTERNSVLQLGLSLLGFRGNKKKPGLNKPPVSLPSGTFGKPQSNSMSLGLSPESVSWPLFIVQPSFLSRSSDSSRLHPGLEGQRSSLILQPRHAGQGHLSSQQDLNPFLSGARFVHPTTEPSVISFTLTSLNSLLLQGSPI